MDDQDRLRALSGAANDLRNFTCQMTRHMPPGVGRELEKRVAAVFALACPEIAARIAEWDRAQTEHDPDNAPPSEDA